MAFAQWLQFVFLPRVREIIAVQGDFPGRSMVGVQALREFDGVHEAGPLVTMLSQFDLAIEATASPVAVVADADRARALTWAASAGSVRAVQDQLDRGTDPDVQDVYGVRAVFFAAGYGHTAICAWLIDPDGTAPGADYWGEHVPKPEHLEVLRVLLDRGARFDQPYEARGDYESGGGTPLILAAAFGHAAAVEELLARGADRATTDVKGRTAADWADKRHFPAIAARLRAS